MPIIWRYMLRAYLQIFFLCVTGFIAVLFVIRFKDIADFATLNSDTPSILLFSLYQIPYILPNAVPISCVIAAMLLFQRMSHTNELTALRAAGLNLRSILYPLFLASCVITLLNLAVVAEVAPRCKLLSKELSYKMTAANPFYIISKISEGKMTNAYIDMRALRGGKKAKDVLLILNNHSNERLGIMTAKEFLVSGDTLTGKDVTIVSSLDSKDRNSFDHLVIENQATMTTKASNLSTLLRDNSWSVGLDYLPLRMLLVKGAAKTKSIFMDSTGLEIARRLSIALTPLIFTLMGAAFGMEVGRKQTRKGLVMAASLCAFFLLCFMGAKTFKHTPWLAWGIYFVSYPLILWLSFRSLSRFSEGIE